MKKQKGQAIEGYGYSWVKIMTMIAHDLGIPGGKLSRGALAHEVCKRQGWQMTSGKDIIRRRGLELLQAGAKPARSKPFVYNGLRKRGPLAPPGHSIGAPHPDYRRDDGFYKSPAWRQIRLLALDNCRCCQACGARPPDVVLHVDHVIPRYKAPHLALTLSNLQILCEDCNLGKGAWSMADFREHFRSI